jgi:superfamily II DNA or RNA helicase
MTITARKPWATASGPSPEPRPPASWPASWPVPGRQDGPLAPDRLQKKALTALVRYVGDGGRAVLVMPCGSGKTAVGRWLAERVDARLVVVCVPNLPLLPQTLTAWRMNGAGWAHRSMIVGSDPSNGRIVRVDGTGLPAWAREEVRASTSVDDITRFIREPAAGGEAKLIVSTYHSAPKVAAALRWAGKIADLLVCDEAHQLCGRPRAEFRTVLDDRTFRARRRVAMTATPVEAAAWQDDAGGGYGDSVSMDDITTFGPVAFRAGFADAVQVGRLVDYDVQVLANPAAEVGVVNAGAAVLSAIGDGATRILTFHTRVSHAAELAAHLNGRCLPGGKRIWAAHLEAAHTAGERQKVLARLAEPGDNEVIVVASARVLSEGVDVPAVDTVVFAEPRTSAVDIVQATGRAMRTAPGKTRGRIVLTVDLGEDPDRLDDDSRFAVSRWRPVWLVLRALASMDPRFRRELHRDPAAHSGPWSGRKGPRLDLVLPPGWDAQRWLLRAVDQTGAAWWERFRELELFARRHGHARPHVSGDPLASWVIRQRTMWRDGLLDEERIRALERLPGWVWSGYDGAWWHAWDCWHRWAAKAGRLTGEDRWVALAETPVTVSGRARCRYKTLADFAADTCLRRRSGDLPANLERAAELLPGWRWTILPSDDAAMTDALAEYAALTKTMNVPPGYVHSTGERLGAWLTSVRRRRYTGRISVPLECALNMLSARLAGQGVEKLAWQSGATAWRLGLLALRQYQAREGTCRVPDQYVESLPDIDINLSDWARRQRHLHRHGELSAEYAAALEQVPGWQWEVELRPGYRPVLDDVEHGERTGYAKGCRCDACTDANSGYELARTNGQDTDLVDAGPAQRKLQALLAEGVTKDAIVRAAGVGHNTIDALQYRSRIRPENEARILALTADRVRPYMKGSPTGGRLTEPAGPVLELVEEMVALGWPKAWIARELGCGQGRALQIGRSGDVSVAYARKIRALRQRVGSLAPDPGRRRCEALPPLAEFVAALEEGPEQQARAS